MNKNKCISAQSISSPEEGVVLRPEGRFLLKHSIIKWVCGVQDQQVSSSSGRRLSKAINEVCLLRLY